MKSIAIGDEYSGIFFRHGVVYEYQLVEIKPVERPDEPKEEKEETK